ncbi:MAG: hypothetical protein J5I59_06885 [Saprospiraceae bacterium]|nr:hypothetical protein [Saprospiraceae bacterium]
MFKVLWIDDQYKDAEMIQFAIEADNEGLLLEGYPSFEEGFESLERKLEHFDVILLDGLFFEKKGQEAGTEDESGIGMAIARINELKSKKVFPWFVLSGKDKFTKGENSLLKANKARCFDKTNPSDVVRLFEEMKAAASQQPDAQLKHKYPQLLETCSDQLLGTEHFSRLFALIKHIENVEKLANTEDMLNPIRKIIERIFRRMAEQGIIPETILANKGWINGSSLFLANKHSDYEHLSEIIPPVVSENIHRLLNIIQDASHGEGELKLKVDQYLKSAQSDYLYRSCVYLLFDLLLWFKEFMKNNPDKESNKVCWKSKVSNGDWITGTVSRVAENGWGTFQPDNAHATISIPPKMVSDNHLNENDSIKIMAEPSPDGTKTFIKAISR